MDHIKLGYAPTRRSIFSAPDAIKYRGLTAQRLTELGVDFVDITDINEEGLLYNDADMLKIAEKFKAEKIDGLFLPHCNFGTEYECARLAKEIMMEWESCVKKASKNLEQLNVWKWLQAEEFYENIIEEKRKGVQLGDMNLIGNNLLAGLKIEEQDLRCVSSCFDVLATKEYINLK